MEHPKSILVATDFSSIGKHAVDYAFELAMAMGAEVHLLHVCEPVVDVGAVSVELSTIDQVEREAREQLAQIRKSRTAGETAISTHVEVGKPAQEIVRCAARLRVGLIVTGTHGRRGLRRALLGSVAESVLREAPCPVLVVRPTEPEAR